MQFYEWSCPSACHNFFTMFLSPYHGGTTEEGNCSYLLPLSHCAYHHDIFMSNYNWEKIRSRWKMFAPFRAFPDCNCSLNSQMATKLCSKLQKMPYCFSGSSIKFHGRTSWKINWLQCEHFQMTTQNLNSWNDTELLGAWKRCHIQYDIVFRGQPSNRRFDSDLSVSGR